jgi:5-methylcytosine-specific restriction endonuclease McrA
MINADFRPMSYFPLSLLRWEDAVHAVFNDRVSIVAEYDTWVRSPSTKIRLPSVVVLRKYQPAARRVAFTRFNVFLRDRFTYQRDVCVLGTDVRARDPAISRRSDFLVEHRHGLHALQHGQG